LNLPLAPPQDVNMEAPDDDACVKCHTDEEILKAVAEEDQDVQETLSEGEG
jgi:wobble nucleotide-excising tRNase